MKTHTTHSIPAGKNRLTHLALVLALGAGSALGETTIDVGGAAAIGDTTLTTTAGTAKIPGYGDKWYANGGTGNVYSSLKSPAVLVPATGAVTLRFTHRYNFEDTWDGGAIYVSVNGAAAVYLDPSAFSSNGYSTTLIGGVFTGGLQVFTNKSAGYDASTLIESVASLGTLNAGDTVSVEFKGGWDDAAINPGPNWEIGTVKLTAAGPSDILNVDFNAAGTSGFTVTNTGSVAGPWNYRTAISKFEINADTLAADRYKPDIPGSVIDLNNARIVVEPLTGTLGSGDTFTLFDLSGGTTLTGSANLSLPAVGIWDTSTFSTTGTITLTTLTAANGTWTANSDGNWSDTTKWSGGTVAKGPGYTATFALDVTAARTVTLDTAQTIGNITKTDSAPATAFTFTIGGTSTNSLTLDVFSGSPVITNNDANVASRLIFSRPVVGSDGLTIAGPGMVAFSNSSTSYTGPTNISSGFLDFGGIANANIGGGSGRNITVAAGAIVRFNALSNTYLNRLVETASEITVMTGTTANSFDFSGGAGANLPNAFLGNWASNGAKCEVSGTITPASDKYRLGGKGSAGLLGIVGTNKITGSRGLIVGGTGATGIRFNLAGANDFTGDTFINTGAKLTLGNNLALQNSALDVGAAGGTFACAAGSNAGRITGETAAASPTFGGLKGSRNLLTVFTNSASNNETNLAATSITGFTLNLGTGNTCSYSGAIANFATGTTLTKTGTGTQILAGANTYTGGTTVNNGTLVLSGSPTGNSAMFVNDGTLQLDYGTNDTSKISDLAVLTLGGGTLDLSGGTHPEVVASTTLNPGLSNVTRSSGGAILAMGAITPASGGVINFGAPNIATTTNPNDTSGILGPWATIGGNWAMNDGSGNIVAYTGGYSDVDARGGTIIDGPNTNARIFGDGTTGNIALNAATTTVNTLWQTNVNYAATLDTAGKTLQTGSILIGSGAAAVTVGVAVGDGILSSATAGGTLSLLNNNPAKTLTINAVIADNISASGLVTSGNVVLNGVNTYTGNTGVDGTLEIAGTGQLGGGTYAGSIANNGALLFSSSADQTLSGVISGTCSLTKTNSGTLTLGGANSFSGQLTVQNGTISIPSINNASANGPLGNSGLPVILGSTGTTGTLQYTATAGTSNKPFILASGGTSAFEVTTSAEVLTLSGLLSGGGNLVKSGDGYLTLGSSNASSIGAITINGGRLQFIGATSLSIGGAGNIVIADGAELRMQPGNTGTFVTARNISVTGAGTSGSGAIAAGGGSNGVSQLDGTITLAGPTTLHMDASSRLTTNGSLGGSNTNLTIDVGGSGICTLNGPVSLGTGSMIKTAPNGSLTLANATNAFSGGLIQQGAGAITISTLGAQGSGDIIFDGLSSSGAITFANLAGTIANNIVSTNEGVGGVTKTGAATTLLTGTNTYTGYTTVSAGSLLINGDSSGATGAVLVNGTSTLGGSGTIGGAVVVAGGANLAPGASAGTFSILGDLTVAAMAGGAGVLQYELNSLAGTNDKITVGGSLVIGSDILGFADFAFTNLGGLEVGTYKLITTTGGISGSLDPANLSGLIGTLVGTLQINGDDLELVVAPPTPYDTWSGGAAFSADANGDGVKNGLAFLLGAANPNVNALNRLPTVTQSGGNLVLTFTCLNAASRGTATLNVQHSSDLGILDAWTPVAVPDISGGPTSGVTFAVTLGSPSNSVTATISSTEAAAGKLFGFIGGDQP